MDWARLVNTTTSRYLRDVEVNIMRNRKWLALMQSKGRVKMGGYGKNLDWKVQYKRAPLVGFADGDGVTFARRDRWQTANLEYKSYIMTDMMSQMEKLQNKSDAAIIEVYGQIGTNMMDDIEDQFGDELYVDGYAPGNTRKIHGIESFLGVNLDGTMQGTGFAKPSDSYAGLSTALQAYGGNWTGTWPIGKGDAHYDFFSPIIVNYTDPGAGAYSAATKTWPNTCVEALRKGISKTRKSKSKKGMLDLIMLEDELYQQFLNSQDAKQQINVNRGEKVGLVALGFTDTVNFDGVDVTSEYGLPLDTGYMINTQQMELHSLQPQLFVANGPFFDENTQTWKFQIVFYGNCRFNPKYFGKFKDYGNAA